MPVSRSPGSACIQQFAVLAKAWNVGINHSGVELIVVFIEHVFQAEVGIAAAYLREPVKGKGIVIAGVA
ncbi:hypothetical protein D3C83_275700 [compost metagenome]